MRDASTSNNTLSQKQKQSKAKSDVNHGQIEGRKKRGREKQPPAHGKRREELIHDVVESWLGEVYVVDGGGWW